MRLLLLLLIVIAFGGAQLINIPDTLGPILGPLVPSPTPGPSPTPFAGPSLWELLALTPSLSNFTDILDSLGMRETLRTNALQLTVFAPTNKAIEAFLDDYDEDNGPPDFAQVFASHVNGILITTDDMLNDVIAKTASGAFKRFNVYAPYIYINGIARVDLSTEARDRQANNGYLHHVDAVIPPMTEVEKFTFTSSFSMPGSAYPTWGKLLKEAGIDDELDDVGYSYTFFVPNERALARMPFSRSYLIENPQVLQKLLLYHLVPSTYFAVGLRDGKELRALSPASNVTLKISKIFRHGVMSLNVSGVAVTKRDQIRRNGVIHELDGLLIPPGFSAPPPSVLDVIEAQPELRLFTAALYEYGLYSILSAQPSPSSVTVFAPDDAAVESFSSNHPRSEVRRALEMHIFNHVFLDTRIIGNNDYFITERTGYLTRFNWYGDDLYMNGMAKIVHNSSNIEASNGLVHIVDAVLSPPTAAENTSVYEYITKSNTSLFFAAGLLVSDGHPLLLGDDKASTVFLPTDDAFRALKAGFLPALFKDAKKLAEIIRYHIVPGAYYRVGLASEDKLPTYFSGASLTSPPSTEELFINNAPIRDTLLRRNGVIYPIHEVLLPPGYQFPLPNIYEIMVASPDLSILASSLAEYGLANYYNASAEVENSTNNTLFAPTDSAFLRFAEISASLTNAEIRAILLYHIEINKEVRLANITNDMVVYNEDGMLMRRFNIYDGRYFINGEAEMLIARSSPATNGYIHVLDSVLRLPPTSTQLTVAMYLSVDERFATTSQLLERAMLINLLNVSTVSSTVFAPTEDAWASLSHGTLRALLEDVRGSLRSLLRYHMTIGTYFPVAFGRGMTLPTLHDKRPLNVTTHNGTLMLNNEEFQLTSIFVQNGIIYAIDRVMEPPRYEYPERTNSTSYFIPTDETLGMPDGFPRPIPSPARITTPSSAAAPTPTTDERVGNSGVAVKGIFALTVLAIALIIF